MRRLSSHPRARVSQPEHVEVGAEDVEAGAEEGEEEAHLQGRWRPGLSGLPRRPRDGSPGPLQAGRVVLRRLEDAHRHEGARVHPKVLPPRGYDAGASARLLAAAAAEDGGRHAVVAGEREEALVHASDDVRQREPLHVQRPVAKHVVDRRASEDEQQRLAGRHAFVAPSRRECLYRHRVEPQRRPLHPARSRPEAPAVRRSLQRSGSLHEGGLPQAGTRACAPQTGRLGALRAERVPGAASVRLWEGCQAVALHLGGALVAARGGDVDVVARAARTLERPHTTPLRNQAGVGAQTVAAGLAAAFGVASSPG